MRKKVVLHTKEGKGTSVERLRWLKRHLHHFSLSRAWRWYYRLGFRKGKKKGIEIGRQQGQHVEILNRCLPHQSDIIPQIVQLMDGRFMQVWMCPFQQEHIQTAFPYAFHEMQTDPVQHLPLGARARHQWHHSLQETERMAAMTLRERQAMIEEMS